MHLIRPDTEDVVCARDLPAEMDDGVVLLADRWVARETADRPQPTVLVRSPYGRRQFVGLLLGRLLAERGLAVVVQSVRGTFGSGGRFSPFDERADGLATLRWIREQPWHAGRIGTIGPSYLGLVQWALAGEAGDDLAAMSVHASASQFYDETYAGGSVSLETVASWLVIVASQERRLAPVAIRRGLKTLQAQLPESSLGEIDERVTGAPVAWFREGFEHPGRDGDYWARRDFSAAVPAVTAPVSFVGGWYDILVPWMLDDFEALQAAGRGPRLTIGPWTHTAPGLAAAGQRDGIAWLRAHLLGDDRLVAAQRREGPVRLRITGHGGGWRDFAAWPPPEAGETRLHLHPGGWLRRGAPDGVPGGASEGVPGGASEGVPGGACEGVPGDRYRYDPADPTPSLGGAVLLSRDAVVDNAALEARADVLSYTTEPLTEMLEAIGRVRVTVWMRSSRPHFDVFARVCEVDAEGISRNVCDGLATVSPEAYEAAADGTRRVDVVLWPLGHRFAPGHRIRLLLASGAYPRYARNSGTGEEPARARLETMRPVDLEVLRDAAHPSGFTLPTLAPA